MLESQIQAGTPRREPVQLNDPAERERMTPAALKAFFRLVRAWGLTGEQARALLGGISNGRFNNLRRKVEAGHTDMRPLSMDELQRISFLVGITKALRILHSRELADSWMMMPNSNPIFGGETPVQYAVKEGIPGLEKIRRLLDARRGMSA